MIPDKLTAELSEKYKVSIRLMPDGLSFWGYIPSEKDSLFMETFPFNQDLLMPDALKSIIFSYPCFSFSYQSFHVVCAGGKYTVVPDHVFIKKEKDRLFDFCFPKDPSLKTLVQPVGVLNASILFGVDNEIFSFLLRSLSNPLFIHSISPLLITWQKKSLHVFPKLMHVEIHPNHMDVLCMEQGSLLFVNSYGYSNSNDIIYYLMYICKQTNFNQLDDCITVSGDRDLCRTVLAVISKYVKKTSYLQQTSNEYPVASGNELNLDMISLMECGL